MTRQLIFDLEIDNARGQAGKVGKAESNQRTDHTAPVTSGQCGQVLNLVRQAHGVAALVPYHLTTKRKRAAIVRLCCIWRSALAASRSELGI